MFAIVSPVHASIFVPMVTSSPWLETHISIALDLWPRAIMRPSVPRGKLERLSGVVLPICQFHTRYLGRSIPYVTSISEEGFVDNLNKIAISGNSLLLKMPIQGMTISG